MIKIPPNKILAYIKKRFDYKERRDGEELVICNPLNMDSGYHFNINIEKGICHDWRGDLWAGPINAKTGKRPCNIIRFVTLYEKCSVSEAISKLLDGDNVSNYQEPSKEYKEYDIELPPNKQFKETETDTIPAMLKNWLHRRGYTAEDITNNDLRYSGTEVIWPYYEFESIVYWQSRSYLNKKFRFPSPDVRDDSGNIIGKIHASKGQFLYGFDDITAGQHVIITEAIFDKHTLGEQTLASGGAALTENQILKLRLLNPKKGIILAPDNDKAGLKSLITNYNLLESLNYKTYYSLPPLVGENKTDWNELFEKYKKSKKEIRDIFEKNIKVLNIKEKVRVLELVNRL